MNPSTIILLFAIILTYSEWNRFNKIKNTFPEKEIKRLKFNTATRMFYLFIWPYAIFPFLIASFFMGVLPRVSKIDIYINIINTIIFIIITPIIVWNTRKKEQQGCCRIATRQLFIPLINILIAIVCGILTLNQR